MGDVWFYELKSASVPDALPRLLAMALGKGWRIELRGKAAARMAALDQRLWDGPPEAFLPHGLAGGPHDAEQPVLLTTEGQEIAARDCVMLVDGAAFDAAELVTATRICVVFTGEDEGGYGLDPDAAAVLHTARAQWKQAAAANLAAQYWSQGHDGRWVKKLERAAG